MSAVLAVSFGPVQDFIASARRTRDLWAGSRLLSEVSRAAAQSLRDGGATLIFPTAQALDEGGSNIANQLLAVVPVEGDAAALATRCVEAARDRLTAALSEVRAELLRATTTDVTGTVLGETATAQLQDLLEAYWAWAPCPEGPDGYARGRQEAVRLLAARKTTRDFAAVGWGSGAPKSSLDGQREAVTQPLRGRATLRLGLRAGELLCAPGLVKRVAQFGEGQKVRFLSTAHVAAGPYLARLRRGDEANLHSAYGRLFEGVQALGVPLDDFEADNIDPRLLYPSRLLENLHPQDVTPELEGQILEATRAFYSELGRAQDRPSPYYAVLLGDGDKMGRVIGALAAPEAHQQISAALHAFSQECAEIVSRHQGALIYAGGDDVMAFLPTPSAAPCALELSESFRRHLSPFRYQVESGETEREWQSPTLTSGLVVAHMLDPLQDVLDAVRAAEKLGKKRGRARGGDQLHLALLKRSGSPTEVTLPNPDVQSRLGVLIAAFVARTLPSKLGYELRDIGHELAGVRHTRLERSELRRVIARKRVADDTLAPGELRPTLSADLQTTLLAIFDQLSGEQVGDTEKGPLSTLADLLIIAAALAGQQQGETA